MLGIPWLLFCCSVKVQKTLLLLLSCFSRVRLCATPQMAAHQAPPSLDSPGKNPGVGCHFLLQCMKVKSQSKSLSRARLLVTPWTAAYQAPPAMGFSRQEYWSGSPLPSPTEERTQLQNWRKGIYSPCLYMVSHTHKPEKVFKLSWNSNFHKINWQILIVFGSHIWDQKKVFFQTLQRSMAKLF